LGEEKRERSWHLFFVVLVGSFEKKTLERGVTRSILCGGRLGCERGGLVESKNALGPWTNTPIFVVGVVGHVVGRRRKKGKGWGKQGSEILQTEAINMP